MGLTPVIRDIGGTILASLSVCESCFSVGGFQVCSAGSVGEWIVCLCCLVVGIVFSASRKAGSDWVIRPRC